VNECWDERLLRDMSMHMNKRSWLLGLLVVAALAGCGSSKHDSLSFLTNHAVGTYIGGGSMIGADSCTYAGAAGMFEPRVDSLPSAPTAPDKGPRFVLAPGSITKECGGTKTTVKAVVATEAKITGPTKVKSGTKSESYQAELFAEGKRLGGEAYLDWKLGPDCDSIAHFAGVLGAQDTGGADRQRELVTTAKGTCTVTVAVSTGNETYKAYTPQTFKAELKVTIE
jgi:hypothetical protein